MAELHRDSRSPEGGSPDIEADTGRVDGVGWGWCGESAQPDVTHTQASGVWLRERWSNTKWSNIGQTVTPPESGTDSSIRHSSPPHGSPPPRATTPGRLASESDFKLTTVPQHLPVILRVRALNFANTNHPGPASGTHSLEPRMCSMRRRECVQRGRVDNRQVWPV